MKISSRTFLWLPVLGFQAITGAWSAPMIAPTFEEALSKSEHVVVTEYLKYEKRGPVDYFYGPFAIYRVVKVLKGKSLIGKIRVRYDFDDGSACIVPEGFKFNDAMMPAKGSQWILFLTSKDSRQNFWGTYRGDYGRWTANEDNLKKVVNSTIHE